MSFPLTPHQPPDSIHLRAAEGWLELGNPTEAHLELDQITLVHRLHPDVLKIRWAVYAKAENWIGCANVGNALINLEPEKSFGWINRSYGLRRVPGAGLQIAYDALLLALDRTEDLELITFNLACYACQLGKLDDARTCLSKSFALARKNRRLTAARQAALADPDLEPLWPELGNL